MHVLTILMKFFKYSAFLTTTLRCFYKILSGPGADKLLYLLMALVNSLFGKEDHVDDSFDGSSPKTLVLIWQFWTKLNVWWRTYYKLLILMYSWLLYYKTSIFSNLHLLTHFIRSHSLKFLDTISWILSLKKIHFVLLTVSLNVLQSFILLDNL